MSTVVVLDLGGGHLGMARSLASHAQLGEGGRIDHELLERSQACKPRIAQLTLKR